MSEGNINLQRPNATEVGDNSSRELLPARRSAWRLSIGLTAAGILLTIVLLQDTVGSAASLWFGQSPYNHALLILPISIYLIWRKRREALDMTPSGSLVGVAVTGLFGLLWLVSDVAEIDEGRHFAFVGILQGILLACLGWQVFKVLSLPFLYLWLLVPTGEFLLPTLQGIATYLSSTFIRWSGIPVFVTGFVIEVPSGLYHVAPGCAGLNFILAMLAIAPLYAHLFYRSAWKRTLAVAAAILFAILMNGVRIAAIIALAHWTDQSLNIVDDHLFYGWGFFVVVLFSAGYLGLYLADPTPEPPRTRPSPVLLDTAAHRKQTALIGTLSVLAVVIVFTYSVIAKAGSSPQAASLRLPSEPGGWRAEALISDWSPVYPTADLVLRQAYIRGGKAVELFVAYYKRQMPGREMIAFGNQIVDGARWRVVHRSRRTIDVGRGSLPVVNILAESSSERRRIWMTYLVDSTFTANPMIGKLLEAKSKLLFRHASAATVAVSTSEDGGSADAELRLQSFVKALWPIEAMFMSAATAAPWLRTETPSK